MALFHDSAIAGASGQAVGDAYKIERSLRFNGSADSAYLSRTPASAGNRKTWTWSGWVKRSSLSPATGLFAAGSSDSLISVIYLNTDGKIWYYDYNGTFTTKVETASVYRDFSAWYHIVVAVNTTQATAASRVQMYVNGSEVTTFSTATYPSQNFDTQINTTTVHTINKESDFYANYGNQYLAEVFFIDGQALGPTSFAETNATTGQWVPKAYTGTYGTNGFRLAFADNSNNTATTLGKDTSGNGNNWTPNNLSVTAGAGNDSLVDTPTSYGTDTGAGGEVRGNYCTWNPLNNSTTLSNGNLQSNQPASQTGVSGTIYYPTAGKWIFETQFLSPNTGDHIGIINGNPTLSQLATTSNSDSVVYRADGNIFRNTGGGFSIVQTVASATSSDIISVGVNTDAGTVQFYKNGSALGTAVSLTANIIYTPWCLHGSFAGGSNTNFGQRQWAYQAPAGFKALCDTNLPAPVVAKPNSVFDVKLYTGNGSTQTISGLGFSPDLVWIKSRSSSVWWNLLFDQIRGAGKWLSSNATDAEAGNGSQLLTAFTSGGFSLNLDPNGTVNANGDTYVAWAWDAGSSTVTNTQGSITSQVRANASAGFSIVTYSQGATNGTIGHGLGIAPAFIIAKSRTVSGTNWPCYHISLGKDLPLQLSTTSAQISASNYWGTTAPSATTFGVGTAGSQDNNNGDMVAYCFAPVAGYSSFGSWQNNGSTDGTFVYLGFRPRFILLKNTDNVERWFIIDSSRHAFNVPPADATKLNPNNSNSEGTNLADTATIDFLSNGFKIRTTNTAFGEISFGTRNYVYAAFAENCFQYARAR